MNTIYRRTWCSWGPRAAWRPAPAAGGMTRSWSNNPPLESSRHIKMMLLPPDPWIMFLPPDPSREFSMILEDDAAGPGDAAVA